MNASANLMSPELLVGRLGDPDLRVIDARFELSDPGWGAAAYAAGHVPGALFLDLDRDLSSAPGVHGGRHPLPDMAEFTAKLGALGVGPKHDVVVYDQSCTMYSARAWWLLRYAGHERVWVLDGGLAAYLEAGGPLTSEAPRHAPTEFPLLRRPEMVVDAGRVKGALGDPRVLLLDARAPERYRGEVEPLDRKAGHIPGALNRPYTASLAGGRFRDREELARELEVAADRDEVIVYCGSGVSGAHLLLALEEAGYGGAKLYAGSWSDWSSYDDLPVAAGDEE